METAKHRSRTVPVYPLWFAVLVASLLVGILLSSAHQVARGQGNIPASLAFYILSGSPTANLDEVVRVLGSGGQQTIITSPGDDLQMLGNELYLINGARRTVQVYDLTGNLQRTILLQLSGVNDYLRLTVIPDGRLAVMDNRFDKVYFTDSTGNLLATTNLLPQPDTHLQNLHGVIVGNRLIVSEDGNKRLIQIDLTTYQPTLFRDLATLPDTWLGALAYANGQYYLSGPNTLYTFTEGGSVTPIAQLSVNNITDLAVVGNLAYLTLNFPGEIHQVDLTTGVNRVVLSGISYPTALQVSPLAPYIVNSLGDVSDLVLGDNLCQTRTGECTLRAAVEESNAFPGLDTILFANTLPAPATILLSQPFTISEGVTIQGPLTTTVTIDGQRTTRHFTIDGSPSPVTIANLTFTRGNLATASTVGEAQAAASMIYAAGRPIQIINSKFVDNQRLAASGGAFFFAGSDLTIRDSIFMGNRADGTGGAINLVSSQLRMSNSVLVGNRSGNAGGALFLDASTATITNSTFADNQAFTDGGAIHLNASQLTLINSTLSGNQAGRLGGGIANDNGGNFGATASVAIFNSTIVNNRATGGAGLYQAVLMGPSSGITITNSILAGNLISAADISNDCTTDPMYAPFTSLGHNLVISNATGNCPFNASGDQAIPLVQLYSQTLDPTLSNNGGTPTHALLPSSQAINAGDPAGCKAGSGAPLLSDQRGAPRAGRCDIGAYETVLITMSVTSRGTDLEAIRTVTATVYGGELGNPSGVPNVTVGFNVIGGSSAAASKRSDINGQAVFTYTSKATPTRQLQSEQATDLITVWADFDNNGVQAAGEPGQSASPITFVALLTFTADPNPDGTVTLRWQTAVERDNAGFNLYRSPAITGPYSKINPQLIAAAGNGTGASYSFLDRPPTLDVYYYRLEDIDTHGQAFQHEPVRSDSSQSAGGGAMRIFLAFVPR